MAHYIASAVTAGPVTHDHVGVQCQVNTYTLATTASGSVSIDLAAIPAGAKVVDCWLKRGDFGRGVTSGGHVVSLQLMQGSNITGQLLANTSNSFATFLRASAGPALNSAIGYRLTSSANVRLIATTGSGTATTGTGQTVFQLCVQYLCDGRGD